MHRAATLALVAALAGCAAVPRTGPRPAPEASTEPSPAPPPPPAAAPPAALAEGAPVGERSGATPGEEPSTARGAPARERDPAAGPLPSGAEGRLAARARTLLGQRGPFLVAGERYNGDCSGFVAAVYAAEGIDLRGAMQRIAPRERRGARAAWLAVRAHGGAFGPEASPAPGDLVFWHDTYDRNRNRKADDPFTHVGIVERVEGGAVHFIHRGGKGVARGVMTLARPREATGAGGERVNTPLRARSHPVRRGGLAAELFAGFGRLGEAPPPRARPAAQARRQAAPPAGREPPRGRAAAGGPEARRRR